MCSKRVTNLSIIIFNVAAVTAIATVVTVYFAIFVVINNLLANEIEIDFRHYAFSGDDSATLLMIMKNPVNEQQR